MALTDAELQTFAEELRKASQAARELAREHSSLAREQLRDQAEGIDGFIDSLKDARTGAIDEAKARKMLAEKNKRAAELQEEVNELTSEYTKIVQKLGEDSKKAADALQKVKATEAELTKTKKDASKVAGVLEQNFSKIGVGVKIAEASLRWFGVALTNQANQLISQYQEAGGVIEGSGNLFQRMWAQQTEALKLGLSGVDLQRLSNQNRQVFNAMGGTEQAIRELNPAVDRFRALTGDSQKAAEMAADAARTFAETGIKPSAAAVTAYTNDMIEMRKRTNMSLQEASAMFAEIASSEDSIDILRSARADEREAILASQRAYVKNAVAMGMTAEQAKNAAKMLNKMVAAKPLDRLRQAAKIRALGGAMGIAGSEEAAQALISGKKDAASKQALADFSTNAANMMDTMASQGLGSEIFATTLLEKLDLETYFGKGSEFSTTLGPSLQAQASALEKLQDTSNTNEGKMIAKLELLVRQGKLLLSGGSWIGTVLAAGAAVIGTVIGTVLGKTLLEKLGKLLGGIGKSSVPGALSDTDELSDTNGKGKKGSKWKKAKAVGKILGRVAPVITTGMNVYEGVSDISEGKTGEGTGRLVGTAVGGALGLLGGPLGVAIGTVIGGKVGDLLGERWDKREKPTEPTTKETLATQIESLRKETPNTQQLMADNLTKQTEILKQLAMPTPGPAVHPVEMTPLSSNQRKELDVTTSDSDDETKAATIATADGVSKQVTLMDASNILLKQIADISQRQLNLSEKQLVAMTLTDKEKTDTLLRSNLMADNKFRAAHMNV